MAIFCGELVISKPASSLNGYPMFGSDWIEIGLVGWPGALINYEICPGE